MKPIEYLYETIKDPLDDNAIISYLIKESYSEYRGLTHKVRKIKPKIDSSDPGYFSNLIIFQYNLWKNNILKASSEELEELNIKYHASDFGIDFLKLREELRILPQITNYSEFRKLFNNKDSQLYYCSGFVERCENTWLYCISGNINLDKNNINSNDITHRLYVSTDIEKAVLFVQRFMEKCIEHNIPYYLKTPRFYESRDDNVIVYTNDEWLEQHILILKEVIENSKDITFFEPPVLTGKINSFIGYGSEPIIKGMSFNKKRKYFLEITKSESENYFDKNKDKKYLFDGNLISLQEINEKTNSKFSGRKISQETLEVISEDEGLVKMVREKIKSSLFANGICKKSCFDIACLNYNYEDGEYKKEQKDVGKYNL